MNAPNTANEGEIARASELLARYPHVPGLEAKNLVGPAKLKAVEDANMRALLAGIWVRNAARWGHQEAQGEARERELLLDVPSFQVPPEGPIRDRWDTLNTRLLLEWLTLNARLRETEAGRLRDGRGPLRDGHESDVRHRFRQHLRQVYGQAEVDPVWSTFDRERMEEAKAKGRSGRQAWPGGEQ